MPLGTSAVGVAERRWRRCLSGGGWGGCEPPDIWASSLAGPQACPLSFSPAPGPGSPARPFAHVPPRSWVRRNTSVSALSVSTVQTWSPCWRLGSGARALPHCRPGRVSLAGVPGLSCSQRLLLPFSGQGHVAGCGLEWRGPAPAFGGFPLPLAVLSDVCVLRFRLCPGCGSAAVTVTSLDFLCSGRTAALAAGPATSALVSASRSLHCVHPRALFSGLGAQRAEFAVFLLRCLF